MATEKRKPHISGVVTFHNERIVAHRTLLGLERVRKHSEQQGITVELIAVLDNADSETIRIVSSSPVLRDSDQILTVDNNDTGLSRNSGINAANGSFIGFFDGDDYHSTHWLTQALHTITHKKDEVAVHPEYQISFGKTHCIARPPDMDEEKNYPFETCLTVHPWTSSVFARKDTFRTYPYERTQVKNTGFGFEDWHWNLELVAAGIKHVSAPGTAIYYRRKPSSVLTEQVQNGAIIRPSRFFSPDAEWIRQRFSHK